MLEGKCALEELVPGFYCLLIRGIPPYNRSIVCEAAEIAKKVKTEEKIGAGGVYKMLIEMSSVGTEKKMKML